MIPKEKLRIVLVEPEQARNIGAVVRVAANFGLTAVTVVQWQDFTPEELKDIRIASSGAMDLVKLHQVCTLSQALEGADVVLGTSGRQRAGGIPVVASVSEFLGNQSSSADKVIAVVFGRESKGLTAKELDQCHGLLRLPVSDNFPSLNLSHAVAIVIYQALFTSGDLDNPGTDETEHRQDAPRERQERWLEKVNELAPISSAAAAQLRRLLHRANPTDEDVSLLFNLLKSARSK